MEIAQLIAAPLAGTLLADLGAEVVHIEDPRSGGDSLRAAGERNSNGDYVWWSVAGRNKRSVSVDLRKPEGQEIARQLVQWCDVVITNFRVDTLKSWNLDWTSLHELRPDLIMLQVTGFGANTTKRNAPGFGKVGEARSGVVNITGDPDGPPTFTGFSHADSVTGLMGAYAVMAAQYRKAHDPNFNGERVDLALFETLFRLIDWQVIAHDQLGFVAQRHGAAPAFGGDSFNAVVQTIDGDWVTVIATEQGCDYLAASVLGILAVDSEPTRGVSERDIAGWASGRTTDAVLAVLSAPGLVACRVSTILDILDRDKVAKRPLVVPVEDPTLGTVHMQGVVPHLDRHGGRIWRSAPLLGEDNQLVLKEWLGIDAVTYDELHRDGVI